MTNLGPRICLGQQVCTTVLLLTSGPTKSLQFAYNEVSFTIIRLLQEFESIELDHEAQPPDSKPPATWRNAPGTKGTDKIWARSHLTLFSHKGMWMRMKENKDKLA